MFKKLFFMSVMILDLNFLCGMHKKLNKTQERWQEDTQWPWFIREEEQKCFKGAALCCLGCAGFYWQVVKEEESRENKSDELIGLKPVWLISMFSGATLCGQATLDMFDRHEYFNDLIKQRYFKQTKPKKIE